MNIPTRALALPFSMISHSRLSIALPAGLLSLTLALVGCNGGDAGPADDPAPDVEVDDETGAEADEPEVLTGEDAAAAVEAGEAKAYPLDVCIVSGEPLDAMGAQMSLVYEGQQISFCCPGCDSEFLKDPENFLTKLDAEDAPAEPSGDDDHDHDHDHHDHDHS